MADPHRSSALTSQGWVLLLLLGALWGAVYPLTALLLQDFPPTMVVFARTFLGALVLAPLALAVGGARDLRSQPFDLVLAALVQATVPLLLLTFGQQEVPSSVAGIIVAGQPIFVALLAAAFDPGDRPGVLAATGIGLGFLGVALLLGVEPAGQRVPLLPALTVIAAAASYAAGAVYIHRRLPNASPVTVAGSAMTFSCLAVLPVIAPALPGTVASMAGTRTLLAVLCLGVVATGFGLALYYRLIRDIGPRRATLAGYLAPAFAVLYSLPLGEPLTAVKVAGLLLVVTGSALASRRTRALPGT
ncbi:MAG: DMT family transporter [Streptomycetales bacterium]